MFAEIELSLLAFCSRYLMVSLFSLYGLLVIKKWAVDHLRIGHNRIVIWLCIVLRLSIALRLYELLA